MANLLGKRYQCGVCEATVLVTKAGEGEVTLSRPADGRRGGQAAPVLRLTHLGAGRRPLAVVNLDPMLLSLRAPAARRTRCVSSSTARPASASRASGLVRQRARRSSRPSVRCRHSRWASATPPPLSTMRSMSSRPRRMPTRSCARSLGRRSRQSAPRMLLRRPQQGTFAGLVAESDDLLDAAGRSGVPRLARRAPRQPASDERCATRPRPARREGHRGRAHPRRVDTTHSTSQCAISCTPRWSRPAVATARSSSAATVRRSARVAISTSSGRSPIRSSRTSSACSARSRASSTRWRSGSSSRVHGACLGAGIELPAFARHVIAADDASHRAPRTGDRARPRRRGHRLDHATRRRVGASSRCSCATAPSPPPKHAPGVSSTRSYPQTICARTPSRSPSRMA